MFQAEDGIRDLVRSRGLGDVYKRQATTNLIPPYLVEIAWPAVYRITALFGLLFLAAVALLTLLLRRMRLFQAIKLGETA